MAQPQRFEWSQQVFSHADAWASLLQRRAATTLTFHTDRPLAQLQPGEKKKLDHYTQEMLDLNRNPSSGRTTALGRKVEKPADVKPAGPSGQKDRAQHNRKHANK